jgi:hypothetical protein
MFHPKEKVSKVSFSIFTPSGPLTLGRFFGHVEIRYSESRLYAPSGPYMIKLNI